MEGTLNALDVEIAAQESQSDVTDETLKNIEKLDNLSTKLEDVEQQLEAEVGDATAAKAQIIDDEKKLEQQVADEEQASKDE